MARRMLVAGLGNIFFGDDGFGVEAARRLAGVGLPDWVRVSDYGIRALHLAYDLLDGGYTTAVLMDAVARGGAAGTVYLIEPDLQAESSPAATVADPHTMSPDAVLAGLRSLGWTGGTRILVVGCEAADASEGIGLSPAADRAVEEAVRLVLRLVQREQEVAYVSGDSGTDRATDSGQ